MIKRFNGTKSVGVTDVRNKLSQRDRNWTHVSLVHSWSDLRNLE